MTAEQHIRSAAGGIATRPPYRRYHQQMRYSMKKHVLVAATSALLLVFLAASPALAAAPGDAEKAAEAIARYEKQAVTSPSGLKYVVLREGKGKKPTRGQMVDTHYVGRLMDGTLFDKSAGRGPFAFAVGKGKVIKAWDEALLDMLPGEKRALIVPPELGYGSRGAGGVIPPNATLFFEVERLQ